MVVPVPRFVQLYFRSMRGYEDFFQSSVELTPPGASDSTFFDWHGIRLHYLHRQRATDRTVIFVHGAGAHAAALWPYAQLCALDAVVIDLPLFGASVASDPGAIRYSDWVAALTAFIAAWPRDVVLVGFSIGGVLAADVATRCPNVVRTITTCLVEPRRCAAQLFITRFGVFGVVGAVLAPLVVGRVARLRIPMRWVARFSRMSSDPALQRLCAFDPKSGGVYVPLGFLASLLKFRHKFDPGSVELAHPANDHWTPAWLSVRLKPKTVVLLDSCGHFPVEQPGLGQFIALINR